jgi:hypothetical protein
MKTTNPKWRLCACNCGKLFRPTKSTKIYIDKNHADRGYNATKRKLLKQAKEQAFKLQERRNRDVYYVNDQILKKYFERSKDDSVDCLLSTLEDEGFDPRFSIQTVDRRRKVTYLMYQFCFSIREGDYIGIVQIERCEKVRKSVSQIIPRTTKKRIVRSAEWHRARLARNQGLN